MDFLREVDIVDSRLLTVDCFPFSSPKVISITIADGDAVEHHLTGVITLRLQQQRVHIRMARDTCCLCLHSLCASNLQSLRRGVGVQCHILCLERSRCIAVLQKDTAQGCGKDALAHITACTSQHDGMKSLHNVQRYIFFVKLTKKWGIFRTFVAPKTK